MDKLIIENFRCFGTRQEVPLAPLTVLVGENSSGKSSFLAAVRIGWDIAAGLGNVDFNESPFPLGSYEQIATNKGTAKNRAAFFTIGQEADSLTFLSRQVVRIRVQGVFAEHRAQPYLSRLILELPGSHSISLQNVPDEAPTAFVATRDGEWELPIFSSALWLAPDGVINRRQLSLQLSTVRASWNAGQTGGLPLQIVQLLTESPLLGSMWPGLRPQAFAPIRSRPQRTYDPGKDEPDPEGKHIPMILAQLLVKPTATGTALRKSLIEFGRASGLFSAVDIRRLGDESDPFQVMVRSHGARRNLVDVGYGVGQILPILVEIMTAAPGTRFLIQQPEVHLHPRAQAALATLLSRLAKARRCSLIVETHSDYFIDRLRMDIRDRKTLAPEELALLYFDQEAVDTTIHRINIDRRGNIVNPPPSYRRFFLEEEYRFFGAS